MDEKKPQTPDVLEVIDNALTAALREVRRARARGPVLETQLGKIRTGTSHVKMCYDVLVDAGRPLHVSTLLAALADRGATTSRDALASALAKRLAPKGPFVRTAPNTFGLAQRDQG